MSEYTESSALLPGPSGDGNGDPEAGGLKEKGDQSRITRSRNATKRVMERPVFHILILLLTALDVLCVLIDLAYDSLHPRCTPDPSEGGLEPEPRWLEVLKLISEIVTALFVVEQLAAMWGYGIKEHYWREHHAYLHILDAVVIFTTFILEFTLRGQAQEVASLLIILRLWRLVKLSSTIAVGVSEVQEGPKNSEGGGEETETERLQRENEELKKQVRELQARLDELGES